MNDTWWPSVGTGGTATPDESRKRRLDGPILTEWELREAYDQIARLRRRIANAYAEIDLWRDEINRLEMQKAQGVLL